MAEGAAMLLAYFELHFQTAHLGHTHYFEAREGQIGETFTALDSGDPNIGAKVKVFRQAALRDGDLEGTATCDGWDLEGFGGGDFAPADILICDEPAGHREVQDWVQGRRL